MKEWWENVFRFIAQENFTKIYDEASRYRFT